VIFRPAILLKRGEWILKLGKKERRLGVLTKAEHAELMERQNGTPVHLGVVNTTRYWMYQSQFWYSTSELAPEDVFALIEAGRHRDNRQLERARAVVFQDIHDSAPARKAIPDAIKAEVWKRDGGRCVECASREQLNFDHVIPVALGGSNVPANLQILCSTCNSNKGAGLISE
jgi:5-methylcytosine-specific restriction endonuclease McrA